MAHTQETKPGRSGITAPYVSFKTLTNLIERMEEEGLPQKIDRSYITNLPGSTQSMLLSALEELRLTKDKAPTDTLKALVTQPNNRAELVGQLVRDYYADAVTLGDNAIQSQLEGVFAESYGVTGSTRRKAIAFFLAAAKFGEVEVSKHFKTPKATGSGSATGTRRNKGKGNREKPDETPPRNPPPTGSKDPKQRYIELLIAKAEEEMDPDLLDRIERVIGIDSPPASSSPTNEPEEGE